MTIQLENITIYITILLFLGTIYKIFVIAPFSRSMEALQIAIEKLTEQIEELNKREVELRTRVTAIERDVKSAHKRIDTLEGIEVERIKNSD